MSLTFKFDKNNEDYPERKSDQKNEIPKDIERFDTSGNTRHLVFVETSGRQFSRNYSYLISVEFSPDSGEIILIYIEDAVVLKGHNLQNIFEDLTSQSIKHVFCLDKRYQATKEETDVFVTEIFIRKNRN